MPTKTTACHTAGFQRELMPSSFALDCWFLTGPTAGRKTEVGVELALRIGAEIVSMDSMALYRQMDIGTAKPTPRQRSTVPHHLVDVLEPHEQYSVAEYLAAAQGAVEEIRSRGREALFVGGTPLYLKALLRGMFRGPPADWPLRRSLEDEARRQGPDVLHRRLAEVDSEAARRLHANDTRRIVRALEVFAKTGRPISAHQQQFAVGLPAESCRVFVLDWAKEDLAARIDRRVDQMFAAGLVEETRCLLAGLQPMSKTARQALGYREVIEHLEGQRGLEETVALVKTHTRQFAKRQRTWFRSLSECRYVPVSEATGPTTTVGQITAARV
jgi:tRNA dimethylallyltransferase